jgi:hypothetical protein
MARGEDSIARTYELSRLQLVDARCLRASLHDLPPSPAGPSRYSLLPPHSNPKTAVASIVPLVRSRRGVPSLEHAVESSGSPAPPKWHGFDPANLTGGLTRCRVTRSPLVGFLAPAIDTPSRRCWPVRRPTRDHPWFLTTSTAIRRQGCGLVASHCRSEVHRVSCLRALTPTLDPKTVACSVAEASQTPGTFPAVLPPLEEHPSVTAGTHHCALVLPPRGCSLRPDDRNRRIARTSSTRRCSITAGEPVALVARHTPDSILPGLTSPSRFLLTRSPIPPPEGHGTDRMFRPCEHDVLILRVNRCRLTLDRLRRACRRLRRCVRRLTCGSSPCWVPDHPANRNRLAASSTHQ